MCLYMEILVFLLPLFCSRLDSAVGWTADCVVRDQGLITGQGN